MAVDVTTELDLVKITPLLEEVEPPSVDPEPTNQILKTEQVGLIYHLIQKQFQERMVL